MLVTQILRVINTRILLIGSETKACEGRSGRGLESTWLAVQAQPIASLLTVKL